MKTSQTKKDRRMPQLLEQDISHVAQQLALFTIGYEGWDIDGFVDRLLQFGITTLVDVRAMPLSRKKGFSKSALADRLAIEGIQYVHLKQLGSPDELREKLKSDGDYDFFYKGYNKYISTQQDSVEALYQIVLNHNACVMCFERDPFTCHRLSVAAQIKKRDGNGLLIKHI